MDQLVLFLALGGISLLSSWGGVRLIRNYAHSQQPQTEGKERPPESARGGGIVILAIVLLIFMPVGFSLGDPTQVIRFAMSATFIGMIGFMDDLRMLPRWMRIGLQSLATLIFIPSVPLQEIGLPYINLALPIWLGYAVSLLWLVIMTNAYNYMDGLDGLGGGQALLAGGLWVGIGIVIQDPLITLLGLLIAATSAGFLVYNLPPASIFLGDVGTAFLGFSLASLPLLAISRGGSPRLLVCGALFVGLFLFDAAFTFLRYLIKGERHSYKYRSHLYQRLLNLGDAPWQVTMLYLLISIGFGIAGILYWSSSTWIALVVVAMMCFTLYIWIMQREMIEK